MTPWALLMEYDGGTFAGWQRQEGVLSVQQVLEDAASRITGAPAPSFVAGRTDAGVHAAGQVAMLALPERMDADRVREALNFHMKPHPVVVVQAAPAPPGWNPRFSAVGRAYRYRILHRRARPALLAGRVWHHPHRLDVPMRCKRVRSICWGGMILRPSARRRARPRARCGRWTGWMSA